LVLLSPRIPPPPSSKLFPYTTLFRSHRRKMVDRMIQRLERRESHLWTERFLAPAVSSDERWAQRTPLFESVKGLIRSNFVSPNRSEEHTSELQSPCNLVCRLLLEKKK